MPFRKLCLILLLIFSTQCINALTLNVVKTDEICRANGTMTFSVTNTTPGGIIVYTIYRLPDVTTPISVQNTTTIGGLVAGNYRVVATESVGSSTTAQQQDITIDNNVIPLTYQLVSQNTCNNGGTITVNVITGVAVQYEIFQGPVTRPLQSTNVFAGLPLGQYSVRVFDVCGEGVVQTFTVTPPIPSNLDIHNPTYNLLTCNTLEIFNLITPLAANGVIVYPITYHYTVIPPTGPPIQFPQHNALVGSDPNVSAATEIIPYYDLQPYNCTLTLTDGCGNVYESTFQINVQPDLLLYDVVDCVNNSLLILPRNCVLPYTVEFLSAPSGFNPLSYNPNHPGPFNAAQIYYSGGIPSGNYTVQITDACGRTVVESIFILPVVLVTPPVLYVSEGCQVGFGSVTIYPFNPITNITVTFAPAAYGHPLPHVINGLINENGSFYLGNLPPGFYAFSVEDSCGNINEIEATIQGFQDISNVNIIEHCGAFDIDLHSSDNNTNSTHQYWLQKYNPVTNQWEHPLTGVPFTGVGTLNNSNSIALSNNSINYNFTFSGTFRVAKSFIANGNGTLEFCANTLKEFVFDGNPDIVRVYSFACSNGTYDVIVDAVGVAPLQYRIIEKDGQPFLVENGTSYIFLGIAAGRYKFQVEDPCGNILNSEFDVPSPFNFTITGDNLCDGQSGSLTVPNFSILQYTWWRDNDTATILSTTNSIDFPLFNATNGGVYHVRVRYTGNPNSCLDFVLDYTVSGNGSPSAGLDNSVSFCRGQSFFDLNTYLTGNFDSSGMWTEITNSGNLVGNIWNATGVPAGVYHFSYEVFGCSTTDMALILIEIKDAPANITAAVNTVICEGSEINLSASSSAGTTYSWTGPNAFVSSEQNPTITNASAINTGIYTVVAAIGDCAADSVPVTVEVNEVPDFVLDAKCEGGRYIVTVIPVNNSFDVTAVNYAWTGPNSYSNTVNPIDITQLATGDYSVTVTNADGCDKLASTTVVQTICFIPNVITPNNDDTNDSFDLTGFDVSKLEIYNRWGRKVYEKGNYKNEWHGQNMNGGILPDATYFYIIKMGIEQEETKTGWIFLSKG